MELEKLGRWPIARNHYSTFLEQVSQASAIVFDIILAEPSSDDPQLAGALEKNRTIVLPAYIDHRQQLIMPAPLLRNSYVGHVHVEPSVDGVLRDVFHTLTFDGKQLQSISSVVHALISTRVKTESCSPITVPASQKHGSILQQDRMGINFYGPRETFTHLSFSDILEKKFPKSFFDRKIILLGLTAVGIDQDHLTTFNANRNRMPGVEVQANIINNLMDGTHIKNVSNRLIWSGVTLIFSVCFLLFVQMNSYRDVIAWATLSIMLFFIAFVLLTTFHVWIPPVVFFVSITAAAVIAHIFKLEKMGNLLFQAKKDWETSFNSITDAIIIQDQTHHTILSNRSARKGPADFFTRYFKLVDDPSINPSAIGLSVFENSESHTEILDIALNRYFEIHRFPREDENSQINGMIYVIRDVTESINLKNEQMALQSQLIQSQKLEAIGTLAGGIAHDFNNILSAIMGYTQLADLLIPKDNKAHGKLEEVLKACNRAANLVMQILSFSRRTEQEKIPVMIRPIVKEVLKLLRATLPPTIELIENITGKQEVNGYPGQIYQVILNLCTNASQAITGGTGRVEVTLESVRVDISVDNTDLGLQNGWYVKISVADTGKGIHEEIKNRIFEPYFTTKAKDTGTGLGLATTRGIINNHGGIIRFETQENKGTTFHVYLPQVDFTRSTF